MSKQKQTLPFEETEAWKTLKTNFTLEMNVQDLSNALRKISKEQKDANIRRVVTKLTNAVYYLGLYAQTVKELLDIEKPQIPNYLGDKGHKSLLEILKALGVSTEKHKISTWDYTPETKKKRQKKK